MSRYSLPAKVVSPTLGRRCRHRYLDVFRGGTAPCFESVAVTVEFAGLNDVGAVCEDVPVLDVRGVLFVGARDGLAASAEAIASAEYESS